MHTHTVKTEGRIRIMFCVGDELHPLCERIKSDKGDILSMKVGPKNSDYTLTVRYPEAQQELIP